MVCRVSSVLTTTRYAVITRYWSTVNGRRVLRKTVTRYVTIEEFEKTPGSGSRELGQSRKKQLGVPA